MEPEIRDKEYWMHKLDEFFESKELARRSKYEDNLICNEVRKYYETLSPSEKQAMAEIVLEWPKLRDTGPKGNLWRQMNAISLAGQLKLVSALDKLIQIGEENMPHRSETLPYNDANFLVAAVVGALGSIGDPRGLDFLRREADHAADPGPLGEYNAAINAISKIDLNMALDYLPMIIKSDLEFKGEPKDSQYSHRYTLNALLGLLDLHTTRMVVPLGQHLRQLTLEERQFALREWEETLKRRPVLTRVKEWITPETREELVDELAREMGLADSHDNAP